MNSISKSREVALLPLVALIAIGFTILALHFTPRLTHVLFGEPATVIDNTLPLNPGNLP